MNFRMGGCDWPDVWDVKTWPSLNDAGVRSPTAVVLYTDAGTSPPDRRPAQVRHHHQFRKAGVLDHPRPGQRCPTPGGSRVTIPTGAAHPRHSGRTAVAFVDGHYDESLQTPEVVLVRHAMVET